MKQVLCPGQEIPIVHQFFGLLQCLHCLYGIGETPVPREVVIENCPLPIACRVTKSHQQAVHVTIAYAICPGDARFGRHGHGKPCRASTEKSSYLGTHVVTHTSRDK